MKIETSYLKRARVWSACAYAADGSILESAEGLTQGEAIERVQSKLTNPFNERCECTDRKSAHRGITHAGACRGCVRCRKFRPNTSVEDQEARESLKPKGRRIKANAKA